MNVTERCLRLASFSRFVSSYLYCPKSRNRVTGGEAIGATSTRSRPRSCAISRALGVGMTPSWLPSSSITRTCGIRIIWLMRRSRLMVDPPGFGSLDHDGHGSAGPAGRRGTIPRAIRAGQRRPVPLHGASIPSACGRSSGIPAPVALWKNAVAERTAWPRIPAESLPNDHPGVVVRDPGDFPVARRAVDAVVVS